MPTVLWYRAHAGFQYATPIEFATKEYCSGLLEVNLYTSAEYTCQDNGEKDKMSQRDEHAHIIIRGQTLSGTLCKDCHLAPTGTTGHEYPFHTLDKPAAQPLSSVAWKFRRLGAALYLMAALCAAPAAAQARHGFCTAARIGSGVLGGSTGIALIPLRTNPGTAPGCLVTVHALCAVATAGYMALQYCSMIQPGRYLFYAGLMVGHVLLSLVPAVDDPLRCIATFGPLALVVCAFLGALPLDKVVLVPPGGDVEGRGRTEAASGVTPLDTDRGSPVLGPTELASPLPATESSRPSNILSTNGSSEPSGSPSSNGSSRPRDPPPSTGAPGFVNRPVLARVSSSSVSGRFEEFQLDDIVGAPSK